MPSITILAGLTVLLYIRLRKILYKNLLVKVKNDYELIKQEYDKLLQENTGLKQEYCGLEKSAFEIIALYDITKEICKTLELDGVFSSFKEQIDKYIEVSDCRFIKDHSADLSPYNNYTILPFKIGNTLVGYLVADIIKNEDKEKFHILAGQFLLGIKRAHLYQKIQELAITDGLTQMFTRRYWLERFKEEIERSKKFKYSFSFLMVDIDHFKAYNDRYGHLVGDAILKVVSIAAKENIRQIDLIGRYGGEEFAVILTETDIEQARFAAERIRQAIEERPVKVYDEDLKVTISIGISTFPTDGQDTQTLIDKADSALYRAKQAGRNRVCVYGV